MSESRSLNRYLLLIAILLAAVVFLPDPNDSRVFAHVHDLAHAPIFGCVAVLLLRALPGTAFTSKWSVVAQDAAAVAVSAGLGLATEIVQTFVGRDGSWSDLFRDLLGAVAFAALFAALDRRIDRIRVASTNISHSHRNRARNSSFP
jgi:VanZ family protein